MSNFGFLRLLPGCRLRRLYRHICFMFGGKPASSESGENSVTVQALQRSRRLKSWSTRIVWSLLTEVQPGLVSSELSDVRLFAHLMPGFGTVA